MYQRSQEVFSRFREVKRFSVGIIEVKMFSKVLSEMKKFSEGISEVKGFSKDFNETKRFSEGLGLVQKVLDSTF